MRNVFLSVVVISALVTAGVGGTIAGFVDTEISEDNYYQAGIMDLLVNGKNDPVGAKLTYTHGVPSISTDFWVDIYNWGECQGAEAYMQFKHVESVEAGTKRHDSIDWVYAVDAAGVFDYRAATGSEPIGAGVWSSEPEKISEVGGGLVGQIQILPTDDNLLGEDYASGISEHLDVLVVTYVDANGFLVDVDDNGDGVISPAEQTAHASELEIIYSGKMDGMILTKVLLGKLDTQEFGWIHITVHLQQIEAFETDENGAFKTDPTTGDLLPWPEPQRMWWPTNALQGDYCTWDMLFELNTDPTLGP
jgi:hypothetical protein